MLRGGLWAVRDFLGFPSRSKQRPSRFKLHAVNGKEDKSVIVAAEHYPVLLSLPMFAGPNLIPLPDCPRLIGPPWHRFLRLNPSILESHYGATEYAPSSINAHAFARMILKIAHGLAVATYGFDNFRSFLLPYILGQRQDYLTVLGTSNVTDSGDADHELKMSEFGTNPARWIVAHINLFSRFGAPGYRVIVGQHKSHPQLKFPPAPEVDLTSTAYASHFRLVMRLSERQESGWEKLDSSVFVDGAETKGVTP